MTLTDFLLTRIAEDEEVIRECAEWGACFACPTHERFDAARVLAECDAKRQIVERHGPHLGHEPTPHIVPELKWREGCDTLRLLALPYADHPDYREEWKP